MACSRDVAMVTDLWRVSAKIDLPRLHSVRWRSTTDGRIAKYIVALTPSLFSLYTHIPSHTHTHTYVREQRTRDTLVFNANP